MKGIILLNSTDKSCFDDAAFAVLAGGKSGRMGKSKANLTLTSGQTFLDVLLEKAKRLGFNKIYVSGHCNKETDIVCVNDILPDRGPLGGIYSVLKHCDKDMCFIISVDMPLIEPNTIWGILKAHKSSGNKVTLLRHNNKTEPIVGVYNRDVWQCIEPVIKDGGAPVFRALDVTGYGCYEFNGNPRSITNINTMSDYINMLRKNTY